MIHTNLGIVACMLAFFVETARAMDLEPENKNPPPAKVSPMSRKLQEEVEKISNLDFSSLPSEKSEWTQNSPPNRDSDESRRGRQKPASPRIIVNLGGRKSQTLSPRNNLSCKGRQESAQDAERDQSPMRPRQKSANPSYAMLQESEMQENLRLTQLYSNNPECILKDLQVAGVFLNFKIKSSPEVFGEKFWEIPELLELFKKFNLEYLTQFMNNNSVACADCLAKNPAFKMWWEAQQSQVSFEDHSGRAPSPLCPIRPSASISETSPRHTSRALSLSPGDDVDPETLFARYVHDEDSLKGYIQDTPEIFAEILPKNPLLIQKYVIHNPEYLIKYAKDHLMAWGALLKSEAFKQLWESQTQELPASPLTPPEQISAQTESIL